MEKLRSMTDFVLAETEIYLCDVETKANIGLHNYLRKTSNYAKFLKRILELWMFVPCKLVDGVWVVLDEPFETGKWSLWTDKERSEYCDAYEEAKKRCLFNGFYTSRVSDYWIIMLDGTRVWLSWNQSKTIEYLIGYNFKLTETAIKQIEE
jgi:hypothetical protein